MSEQLSELVLQNDGGTSLAATLVAASLLLVWMIQRVFWLPGARPRLYP